MWLLDIVELARVMTDDDWQEVVRTAEHWRAEIPVWWALNRTQEVFKTVMPTEVLTALEPSKQRRTVIEGLAPRAEADHPDGLTQKLFRLALVQREQLPGALERGLRRLVTPG